MRRIMQDLSYLYIMQVNTMQKSQNERLLCHNVFLCVHYACIKLNRFDNFIHILLGYITLLLLRLQFDSFHSFKRQLFIKIRMATLFQLRIQCDSFDQFEWKNEAIYKVTKSRNCIDDNIFVRYYLYTR